MKRVLLLLMIALLSSSCVRLSSFKMDGLPLVKVKGITASGIYIEVVGDLINDGRKVSVEEFELDVVDGSGEAIATISSSREIVVNRGVNRALNLLFKISTKSGILGGAKALSRLKSSDLYVDGYVVAKAGLKSRVKVDMVKLAGFADLIDGLDLK